METFYKKILLLMTMMLLVVGVIHAAGSSTGGSSTVTSSDTPTNPPTSVDTVSQNSDAGANSNTAKNIASTPSTPNCEAYSTVKERVNCRLVYGEAANTIPEPCRGLTNQDACAQLYTAVTPCYTNIGTAKDQCLKQIAGFTSKSTDVETNQTAIRNYVLFLLYDLQDRVEKAYADKQVTSDQAADIIDSIVTAKYAVTRGQSSDDIRAAVDIVKQKYTAVISQ